jgi:membrane protein DedA with SNARE-associated domain
MSFVIENLMDFIHWSAESFHLLIEWIVDVVGALGYPGIVALMFLESSFFPFPSEVVIPPAGYLASKGQMNLLFVIVCGIIGSMLGAIFNYYIAVKWGRKFFDRYGKYLFVSPEALDKADAFFEKHGHISTFTARLLPVIRQYVSLPAGLARMNMFKFCLYTALGSGIWVVILAAVGYWIGGGEGDMQAALRRVTAALALFCVFLVAVYAVNHRRKRKKGV